MAYSWKKPINNETKHNDTDELFVLLQDLCVIRYHFAHTPFSLWQGHISASCDPIKITSKNLKLK